MLNEMKSFYFDNIKLGVELETRDFNKKYKNEKFIVNDELFKQYLESELLGIEKSISELINKLTEI